MDVVTPHPRQRQTHWKYPGGRYLCPSGRHEPLRPRDYESLCKSCLPYLTFRTARSQKLSMPRRRTLYGRWRLAPLRLRTLSDLGQDAMKRSKNGEAQNFNTLNEHEGRHQSSLLLPDVCPSAGNIPMSGRSPYGVDVDHPGKYP